MLHRYRPRFDDHQGGGHGRGWRGPRARDHQLAVQLRHGRGGLQAGGAHRRPLHAVPPGPRGRAGALGQARRLPLRAGAQLPARAVPGAARRPGGDEPEAQQRLAVPGPREGAGGGARGGVPAAPPRLGRGVRAGGAATLGLLPGYRRLALHGRRRTDLQVGGALVRPHAQRLRQVDHRGGEPPARRRDGGQVPQGAREHGPGVRRGVGLERGARGGRGGRRRRAAGPGRARDPARGDVRRRDRLRPRAPAVPPRSTSGPRSSATGSGRI